MKIFVGQTWFKGSLAQYAAKLNFLELQADPERLPHVDKLKELGGQAPEGFAFSVALSEQSIGDSSSAAQRLSYGLKVATAVSPRWLVIRTPANFRPSSASERALTQHVGALRQHNFSLAWEPRGLWQASRARPLAQHLGLQLVQDASDFEPHMTSYLKIAGFGSGRRVGETLLERVAVKLAAADELYLALSGPGAPAVLAQLEELVELYSTDLDDADAEEGLDE